MTRLSVNINKVATLRNARGEDLPDVVKFAIECEKDGAQGITVHPRPDRRHITPDDVYALSKVVTTEFNIEGYPSPEFMEMVKKVKPQQVTLVPDAPSDVTSNVGWDVEANLPFLTEICTELKGIGSRSSIFVNPSIIQIEKAAKAGADRVELFTKPYATLYSKDRELAIAPYLEAASYAQESGLGVNAGHDLNLQNLSYFKTMIPWLDEVSIGHALISDALYFGIKATIKKYLDCLKQ